ncbi:hypothetical protein ACFOY8_24455 [Thalassospira xianhensis]|nr:hypothetical protein [Thalassospira xianhensis]
MIRHRGGFSVRSIKLPPAPIHVIDPDQMIDGDFDALYMVCAVQ